MRAAVLSCLVLAVPVAAQDKKPDKITAENIEIGKVGVIEKLTVEKVINPGATRLDDQYMIARFDGLRVFIEGYPTKGIGKGKVLPADQLWRVDSVLKGDATGEMLGGCYVIKPEKKEKK